PSRSETGLMDVNEVVQLRYMYDRYYNLIMAGIPISLDFLSEPKIDLIERLKYLCHLIMNITGRQSLDAFDDERTELFENQHTSSPTKRASQEALVKQFYRAMNGGDPNGQGGSSQRTSMRVDNSTILIPEHLNSQRAKSESESVQNSLNITVQKSPDYKQQMQRDTTNSLTTRQSTKLRMSRKKTFV
ncbi:unnamed protein product, partial [Didymodactylos carnosus]